MVRQRSEVIPTSYGFPRNLVHAAARELIGAAIGRLRPDVAQVYGAMFGTTGLSLTIPTLAPGQYDVTAFARSLRTGRWEDARTVRVSLWQHCPEAL